MRPASDGEDTAQDLEILLWHIRLLLRGPPPANWLVIDVSCLSYIISVWKNATIRQCATIPGGWPAWDCSARTAGQV